MDLIKKAKEHLILYHPFFAYLALQVEFVEDNSIETSSIDGITFRYNPDWLAEFDHRRCAGLIAHGMAHVLLLHPIRAEGKSIKKWNAASDYAVNSILNKAHIELMNGLLDARYEGLDTEEIYNKLKDNDGNNTDDNDSGDGDTSGFMGFDDGSDYTNNDGSDVCKVVTPDTTDVSKQEIESQMTQKVIEAAMQVEGGTGDLPDYLKQVVSNLKEPKKDWRELLHKFTAEIARNDYNWEQPDQSYLQRGLYIPGLHNEEVGNVVFAIDTSASVNERLLQEFLSELKEAVSMIVEDVTVIHCDTQVRKVEQVQTEEVDKIVPEGRGNTSFLPVFKHIDDNDLNPKALIYFTDGKCYETLTEPQYPVLWMIYENANFKAQFGETIIVDK